MFIKVKTANLNELSKLILLKLNNDVKINNEIIKITIVKKIAKKIFDQWVIAETDMSAVRMTRYPTGLANALQSLYLDGREPTHNPKFCRHMWVNPPKGGLIPSGFSTQERVVALEEL